MCVLALWALLVPALVGAQARPAVVKSLDAVGVVCEEEPSLSKNYRISRDGYIIMQFIGAISIAGLSESAAAAKIAATLIEQRILPKATVTLRILGTAENGLVSFSGAVNRAGDLFPRKGMRLSDVVMEAKPTAAADLERVRIVPPDGKEIVVNFAQFDGKNLANNPEVRPGDRVIFDLVNQVQDISVTGMVQRPGVVAFKSGMTLGQAIDAVGGVNPSGDFAGIRLERAGAVVPPPAISRETVLFGGDRIFVPQASVQGSVPVSGAVSNPGPINFRTGLTVGQAISMAGGFKKDADPTKVRVIRKVDDKDRTTTIDLNAIQRGMASDYVLRAGDRVEVDATRKRGRNNNVLKVAGLVLGGLLFGILRP
jgi:protein involved in polysaccharide export with SLBB domain